MPIFSTHRRTFFVTLALTLLAALCVIVWLTMYFQNERYEVLPLNPDRSRYPVRGADISAHNGIVDFEALRNDSLDFVILKATEGATFKDKNFVNNYRRARRAGLKVGAYHFFRFDTPGRLQALNLLHSVRDHQPDLPLVIDIEEANNPKYIDTDTVLARLATMVKTLKDNNHRVVIYTNKKGIARFFPNGLTDSTMLWISTFTEPHLADRYPWHLWQFTHRGSANGVSGAVDLNTFNGTREEFALWLEDR
ncbi:MAG: hypothetical protein HUK14_11310 [Muribaculaceae bacterium]|nr:hypothetical protein [Muribaculaceae bacterium]